MIPIKFRGKLSRSAYNVKIYPPKILNAGTVVYGDLIHFRDGVLIRTEYDYYENKAIEYFVDPDSVAQLVGYDKDGREVYAGDVEIDKQGNEYVVQLRPCVVRKTPLGEDIHFDVDKFTLKEETP